MTKKELEKYTMDFMDNETGFAGSSRIGSIMGKMLIKYAEVFQNRIEQLEKENAELDCQKNRNKFCYSCANATERCFRNEIGCPCGKYKSYKDENAELKNKDCWKSCEYANPKAELIEQHIKDIQKLTKAKELLAKWVELFKPKSNTALPTPIQVVTEQFLSEVEK